jgi:hypothetical protein
MPPRITKTPVTTNRDLARHALAAANHAPKTDNDTMLIAALGIGWALLDVADAFRERNYLISDMLREDLNADKTS